MTMRKTPFMRLRYPWASDVVSVADVQSLGADIDQALVQTANLGLTFPKMPSVIVRKNAAQSITASTVTTVTMDTIIVDNGPNSPVLNSAAWYNSAASTSRLTAPFPCVVLAQGGVGINFTAAVGSVNAVQCMICINGGTGAPNVQGSKFSAISTISGVVYANAVGMWKLNTGDYLELKTFWRGTPAGPLNTDTNTPPQLALSVVALPTVP